MLLAADKSYSAKADLLAEVTLALRLFDLSATKFGTIAAGDPRLVHDMRMGRALRPATQRKVLETLNQLAHDRATAGMQSRKFLAPVTARGAVSCSN